MPESGGRGEQTEAVRGLSPVFLGLVVAGLALRALLYPRLPPLLPSPADPSVPGDMPRWLWVGIEASILVLLVPIYAGLRREGRFWSAVWRQHPGWYDALFCLLAGVGGLWSGLFTALPLVPVRLPDGLFWSGVLVPFLIYSAALLQRPWAPSLWPPVREALRSSWTRAVAWSGKAHGALAVVSLVLFHVVGADAIWAVGLVWTLLWRTLSQRHEAMRDRGEEDGRRT